MGKFIRKCQNVGEVAVMEVAQPGVRTRARAMAMPPQQPAKRRKVACEELRFSSSSLVTNRRELVPTPENCASPANSRDPLEDVNSGDVLSSCCSSNGSTEPLKFLDLEEDENVEIERSAYKSDRRRERRETTPTSEFQVESGELESTAKPSDDTVSSRQISTVDKNKFPSADELEEFFAKEEKVLTDRFKEKYNFDFVNEVPLEGRYEWVKLKPSSSS